MSIYIWQPVVVSDMQWPCPDGFHVPLSTERAGLRNIMNSLTFQESYWVPWRIYLKMPYTWYRDVNGSIYYQNSEWYYWACNWYQSSRTYFLSFSNYDSASTWASGNNSNSHTIRPFKDSFVVPTSSWTVLNWTLWGAWIFRNQADWLISITSDGTTWYTIADKNLWATTVYNDWDTLSEANCWKYYQKWNNYWFPWDWTISKTSSTQVDVSTYWPWNYYSSDTYITTNPWYSSYNGNIRWWVSQWTFTKTQKVQNIYIGDTIHKTFTITWTEASDPTQFNPVYSDNAAWLTPWSTDFDEFFWYYWARLSAAWLVTNTVQQSSPWILDITQLGTLTSGDNVMIAFPRRWIKMSKSWNQVTLSITNESNKDGYQYYAHTKWSDVKDVLYLWAYKMSSWYASLSWKAPLVNKTRAWFRSWIRSQYYLAQADRYSQISLYASWYINALYMMKYGNPNFQSVIWKWYTWGSAAVNTWGTNSQTSASYWTSSLTVQAKLFWLEDLWGNVYEFIDCCYSDSNWILTADKTNSVFQDSAYSTTLWLVSTNYLTSIDWSNDGMFKMTNNSWWSHTTYYTAYYSDPYTVLFTGDSWSSSSASHLWISWWWYDGVSWTSIWARLMYL